MVLHTNFADGHIPCVLVLYVSANYQEVIYTCNIQADFIPLVFVTRRHIGHLGILWIGTISKEESSRPLHSGFAS